MGAATEQQQAVSETAAKEKERAPWKLQNKSPDVGLLGRPDWAGLHTEITLRPFTLPIVVSVRNPEKLSIPVELAGTSYSPLAREELEWHATMAARACSHSFKPIPPPLTTRRASDPGPATVYQRQESSTRSSASHQRGRAKFATHRRFLEVPEGARLTDWISVQKELHANVLAREPNASNRNSDSQASRPRLYVLPPVKGWAGDIDGNMEGKDIRH